MKFDDVLNYITGKTNTIPDNLRGVQKLSTEESLNIYRTDYFLRLESVLKEHFPMTNRVLGDTIFNTIAIKYIASNPSNSWDINCYGNKFPFFFRELINKKILNRYPFIEELAQIEWDSHKLFHMDISKSILKSIPTNETELFNLQFSTSIKIFKSSYSMVNIYRSLQNNKTLSDSKFIESTFYFLYRKEFNVHIERLNPTEYRILSLWNCDETFGNFSKKIDLMLTENDSIYTEIGLFLHKLLSLNLLVIRSHENL